MSDNPPNELSRTSPDPPTILLFRGSNEPYTGPLRFAGKDYELVVWPPELWDRLPELHRPYDAHPMTDGAWFAIRVRDGG